MEAEIRAYLKACLPTGEELERLVAETGPDGVHPNRGWVYDAEIGFVHAPSIHRGDGVNGTNTTTGTSFPGTGPALPVAVLPACRPGRICGYT